MPSDPSVETFTFEAGSRSDVRATPDSVENEMYVVCVKRND